MLLVVLVVSLFSSCFTKGISSYKDKGVHVEEVISELKGKQKDEDINETISKCLEQGIDDIKKRNILMLLSNYPQHKEHLITTLKRVPLSLKHNDANGDNILHYLSKSSQFDVFLYLIKEDEIKNDVFELFLSVGKSSSPLYLLIENSQEAFLLTILEKYKENNEKLLRILTSPISTDRDNLVKRSINNNMERLFNESIELLKDLGKDINEIARSGKSDKNLIYTAITSKNIYFVNRLFKEKLILSKDEFNLFMIKLLQIKSEDRFEVEKETINLLIALGYMQKHFFDDFRNSTTFEAFLQNTKKLLAHYNINLEASASATGSLARKEEHEETKYDYEAKASIEGFTIKYLISKALDLFSPTTQIYPTFAKEFNEIKKEGYWIQYVDETIIEGNVKARIVDCVIEKLQYLIHYFQNANREKLPALKIDIILQHCNSLIEGSLVNFNMLPNIIELIKTLPPLNEVANSVISDEEDQKNLQKNLYEALHETVEPETGEPPAKRPNLNLKKPKL